jgi:hypothetical protein
MQVCRELSRLLLYPRVEEVGHAWEEKVKRRSEGGTGGGTYLLRRCSLLGIEQPP